MISLLLVIGLLLPQAHAAQSELCGKIQDMPTMSSHYVQKVVKRANDAIQEIKKAPKDDDFVGNITTWARRIGGSWNDLSDANKNFTVQRSSLINESLCLQFDVLLLQCKMEEVRQLMNEDIKRGSTKALEMEESLLKFLQERIDVLRAGSLDPDYRDPTWGNAQPFDPKDSGTYCCVNTGEACKNMDEKTCTEAGGTSYLNREQCVQGGCIEENGSYNLNEEMCPFDSDYATAQLDGFGCDAEKVRMLEGIDFFRSEAASIRFIVEETERQQKEARAFLQQQKDIDVLFGNPPTQPAPPREREHIEAFGCAWKGNYCYDDHTIRCTTSADCGGSACANANYICKGNRNLRCIDDNQCGGSGPCVEPDSATFHVTSLRGPFALGTNDMELLQQFMAKRILQGESREFADDLKQVGEFASQNSSDSAERALQEAFAPLRQETRTLIKKWSGIQGREEAVVFPYGVDPQLQVAHELAPLRMSVAILSAVSNNKKGLRAFVVKLASFIRRTCIYRTCNTSLDQILKITLEDKCFPYTNGEFLGDTESDSRAKKCREEAKL